MILKGRKMMKIMKNDIKMMENNENEGKLYKWHKIDEK
jgi:hypothetical protein